MADKDASIAMFNYLRPLSASLRTDAENEHLIDAPFSCTMPRVTKAESDEKALLAELFTSDDDDLDDLPAGLSQSSSPVTSKLATVPISASSTESKSNAQSPSCDKENLATIEEQGERAMGTFY